MSPRLGRAFVGDISCQPGSPVEGETQANVCDTTGQGDTTANLAQTATANQIEAMRPNLVALLGDEQYRFGRYRSGAVGAGPSAPSRGHCVEDPPDPGSIFHRSRAHRAARGKPRRRHRIFHALRAEHRNAAR